MRRGIFITGTGTGVGKTLVAAAVLHAARAAGIDAAPLKPVQTGSEVGPDGLRASDLEYCLAAAGMEPPADELRLMAPALYRPACSPHLAARMEGRPVNTSKIVAAADELGSRHEAVIAEGAGGVMVPLSESTTMLDLMAELAMPVVVVALDGLGTINHTLLTLAALRAAKLDVLGVVFNRAEPLDESDADTDREVDAAIRRDNPEIVARLGETAVLGCVPYIGQFEVCDDGAWRRVLAGPDGMKTILERLKAK